MPKENKSSQITPVNTKLTKGKAPGGPIGNKHREIYTLPVAINLFEKALEILKANPDIITETELAFKCKYELSLPYSTYQYLRSEKYPMELGDLKREIESLLESRVMKCKEMYPGIAAMTLKNKHKWVDQVDTKITGTITLEQKLAELESRRSERLAIAHED